MDRIEDIIKDLENGRMVIIMDDEDRENEGDLLMAADAVTADAINFMARFGRGLICLTLTQQRCRQLKLPLMVSQNGCGHGTNFTISIEAAEGVTTGISAADRARTIQVAVAADVRSQDIVQPGHVFPLMAQPGGVLTRAGHTEAGCDLARLAGHEPAAVIVEILNDDGTMARRPDLEVFAKKHGLRIGTIADLIEYRIRNEKTVEHRTTAQMPTEFGDFDLHVYEDTVNRDQHLALVRGRIDPRRPSMVRVHVHNPLKDLAGAMIGDSAWDLQSAMQYIAGEEQGVVVILQNQISQDEILSQVDAFNPARMTAEIINLDERKAMRTMGLGAQILKDLGVCKMRVLGAPRRMPALAGFGLEVDEYIDAPNKAAPMTQYMELTTEAH